MTRALKVVKNDSKINHDASLVYIRYTHCSQSDYESCFHEKKNCRKKSEKNAGFFSSGKVVLYSEHQTCKG